MSARAVAVRVHLTTLGCAKNRVDSERVAALLMQAGLLVAADPADADVCVVNTCGFIAEARAETLTVLAELKRGTGLPIVALGCLVARAAATPDAVEWAGAADALVSFPDYLRLPAICRALARGHKPARRTAATPPARTCRDAFANGARALFGSPRSVYLKLAEGCSNRCAYCAIPLIRGPQRSRPLRALRREADELLAAGAWEINLIAQDTGRYGCDRYGRPRLADLVQALGQRSPATWWRVLYTHPAHLDDALLDALSHTPGLCPYLDLPWQHAADPVLRAMGRGITRRALERNLARIRARWPAAVVRTTLIVGFPNETPAHFETLRATVAAGLFDYLGVFTYSPEVGTPAARLGDPVPAAEKEARRVELLRLQQGVTARRLRRFIGQTVAVLPEGPAAAFAAWDPPAEAVWAARTSGQAPEVDGVVWLTGEPSAAQWPRARITAVRAYDLLAEPV
ncbi:MAG: MiaB/RimO family radical SAM methylthiotransferase [Candidatus Marinimicrobia bacterium]|nr:MiaB/RimO family radical SAM methylthiotransferase [Candidatus Neomarinimicrobiota bacterium]